jgi:GNAT superfamily N-acetyltransferase
MFFRRASEADYEVLAAMNQQLIKDEGHRNPMSVAELEQRIKFWVAGDYRGVIFEEGHRPVGYALYREEPEYIYLRQFFIAEECRRQGHGRAAMAWLCSHVWPDRPVRVEALAGNAVGLAFWRSLGFGEYSVTFEKEGVSGLP